MLGNFPWYAWHVRGHPGKNIIVSWKEINGPAFLFVRKRGGDGHGLGARPLGVDQHVLDVVSGREVHVWPLVVGNIGIAVWVFGEVHLHRSKVLRGGNAHDMLTTLHLARTRTPFGGGGAPTVMISLGPGILSLR